MDNLLIGYIEDLKDYIILFNEALIKIEGNYEDKEVINTIFRVAHTIKGNSAAMQFMNIKQVMHTMEDILHEVREGKRQMTGDLIQVLFSCHDFLEDCIVVIASERSDENMDVSNLQGTLNAIADHQGDESKKQEVKDIKAQVPITIKQAPIDFPFDVQEDTYELILENIRRGMTLLSVRIELKKSAEMKSIRNVIVFNDIEEHGFIMDSIPKKPEQEFICSADFCFDHIETKLLILTDESCEAFNEIVSKEPDIEHSQCYEMTLDQLRVGRTNYNKQSKMQTVMAYIEDIKIELLDLKSESIKNEAVEKINKAFSGIREAIEHSESHFAKKVIDQISQVVSVIKTKNPVLEASDLKDFIALCTKLSELVEDPSLEEQSDYVAELGEKLEAFSARFNLSRKRLGDLLVDEGIICEQDVHEILELQKTEYSELKFGQVAVKEKKATADDIINTLSKQSFEKENPSKAAESNDFVRISSQKVDLLVEMLGELIIFNSQLEQHAAVELAGADKTMNILPRMAKLIKNIQDLSMTLRMVSIKPVLHKLTRISRDTAAELGKKIVVVLEGENTELDKSASEKIFDPLMHMVRNSVSHGIESEALRLERGKKPEGTIKITAYNKRSQVYIEVSDDGGGIDPKVIYKKAKEKNMIDETKEYTEEEIIRFIFHPGFSTQENINSISGRGVGMNVVEAEVTRLRGKVEIKNELGKGCTFIMKIPMNLAVLNGTIVELEGNRFIIPTLFIKQFFITQPDNWVTMQGIKKAIRVRDSIIPIITADHIMMKKTNQNLDEIKEVVILELEQKHVALPVNRIVGRQEVVAKPLNEEFASTEIFSGASILGDGRVTMILDVEALYKLV